MGDERSTVVERKKVSGLDETEHDTRPSSAAIQRTVGRFTIERELGSGGMGVVLLAHDPTLDRRVAIKLLHDDRGAGSAGRVRMLREAQAMAKLRHPNVVTVYEAGIQDANVYLVMELIEGGTLRAKLPSLDEAAILRVFIEAGLGLAAAHRAGLVHRDFKPDNVMLDEHGHAKVTDFGLAARDDSVEEPRPTPSLPELDALSHTLTRTGAIMGTPRYMAPEQHVAGPTDARTDQFSFCVALYEALFGRHPFQAATRESLAASVLEERPRRPESSVSSRITDAVMRGLSREPGDRFPDMETLLAELAPPRRRTGVIAIGLGSIAIGILVFALTRSSDDPVAAARAIAAASNSELIDLQMPPGTQVTGIRSVGSMAVSPVVPATWLPTGQLALPRGPHVIEYRDDAGSYGYAAISHGDSATRTIALPAPEHVEGSRFIAGGEVEIGDANNQPIAVVQLAPYSIAEREEPAASYDDALKLAADRHARLPTAAEWEWAARLGMRYRSWEWTASQFSPYPYAADDREDPFANRDKSEVRGDGAPANRRAGSQRGKAGVRLARTARAIAPLQSVTLEMTMVESSPGTLHTTLAPREHARLARFLVDWVQLPDRPSLRLENGMLCDLTTVMTRAGVPYARVEEGPHNSSAPTILRWHPDRAFTRTGKARVMICDNETQVLDDICFQGDTIHPASGAVIAAVASTLKANPVLEIEVQAFVGPIADPIVVSERRAAHVRDRLLAEGVAPGRVRSRGYGSDPASTDDGLFAASTRTPPGCNPAPGERIGFKIIRR